MKSIRRSKTPTPHTRNRSPLAHLGVFHYFEVMDRAATAANSIEDNIGTHPVVKRDARVREAYEALSDTMGAFYQVAGTRFFQIAEANESLPTNSAYSASRPRALDARFGAS